MLALEDHEPLPEGKVFDQRAPPSTEATMNRGHEEYDCLQHAVLVSQPGCGRQSLTLLIPKDVQSFGEASRERIEFLRQCILDASDDTMALRILTILPQQKDDSNLEVSIPDLPGLSLFSRFAGNFLPFRDITR